MRITLFVLTFALSVFAGNDTPGGVGTQVAVRHHETACAYYVLSAADHEKAIRFTEDRDPEQLGQALDLLSGNSTELLARLKVKDLSHVVIGSVGAPLDSAQMKAEEDAVKKVLAERGLGHIPVKVFPRPYTFLQQARWQFPIQSDSVPPNTAEEEVEAQRRGVQIAGAANVTTWVTLAFLDPSGATAMGYLLSLPTVSANIAIDYLVGLKRPSINNFLARAGESKISGLFRDSQVALLFAIPFYLIPRFRDFVGNLASGDTSSLEPFLNAEFGTIASNAFWGTLGGIGDILTSSVIQALQIFTFMNPNSVVDKKLINAGSSLSESELSQRNAWRIAGFFAISAPLFAAANSPAIEPLFGPIKAPHIAMAGVSLLNYLSLYNRPFGRLGDRVPALNRPFQSSGPENLTRFPLSIYQNLGWLISEYPVEYAIYRPLQAIKWAWRKLRGTASAPAETVE
jgi:hypothetical protein